jgi:tetratricopeptide (TPR) repeat protein
MRLLNEIRHYMGNYHVKSGVYHFYRHEYSQAVTFLRKALNDETGLSDGDRKNARRYLTLAHKAQAEKLAAGGDLKMAIEELRRAAEVNPTYPDIHYLTAQLLERTGLSGQAVLCYRKAIACHPGYLDARVALGQCLTAAGKLREAAKAFEEAYELKQRSLQKPFEQGVRALRGKRIDEALAFFHEVFLVAPGLAESYVKKAAEWVPSRSSIGPSS